MNTVPLGQALGDPADGVPAVSPESITRRLDTQGLSCPMPIVRTAQAMASLAPGQLLEVLAYSPKSVTDFAAWAKSTGNPLIDTSTDGGVYRFVLRRK